MRHKIDPSIWNGYRNKKSRYQPGIFVQKLLLFYQYCGSGLLEVGLVIDEW
jgi:hypothetical protein